MPKSSKQHYDWDIIRQEYITTNTSLSALTAKYGVRERTVQDRCAKEGWVQQRKDFSAQIVAKTLEKAADKIAGNQADILAKVLTCAEIGVDKALVLLSGSLRASDLEHIVNSLRVIEGLARSIQGILTVQEEHRIHIENERLKMDRQRAEAFDPDSEIVIKIEGASEADVREWAG